MLCVPMLCVPTLCVPDELYYAVRFIWQSSCLAIGISSFFLVQSMCY